MVSDLLTLPGSGRKKSTFLCKQTMIYLKFFYGILFTPLKGKKAQYITLILYQTSPLPSRFSTYFPTYFLYNSIASKLGRNDGVKYFNLYLTKCMPTRYGKVGVFAKIFQKKRKMWLTGGIFIVYNECRFLTGGFMPIWKAGYVNRSCIAQLLLGRIAGLKFNEEVSPNGSYLSAQEASALQGAWFPQAYGYPQWPQGSGSSPCQGPRPSDPLISDGFGEWLLR